MVRCQATHIGIAVGGRGYSRAVLVQLPMLLHSVASCCRCCKVQHPERASASEGARTGCRMQQDEVALGHKDPVALAVHIAELQKWMTKAQRHSHLMSPPNFQTSMRASAQLQQGLEDRLSVAWKIHPQVWL